MRRMQINDAKRRLHAFRVRRKFFAAINSALIPIKNIPFGIELNGAAIVINRCCKLIRFRLIVDQYSGLHSRMQALECFLLLKLVSVVCKLFGSKTFCLT